MHRHPRCPKVPLTKAVQNSFRQHAVRLFIAKEQVLAVAVVLQRGHRHLGPQPAGHQGAAGPAQRLRPVLLTTITTVCGLLPLACGYSIDLISRTITAEGEMAMFWAPLALPGSWPPNGLLT